ncbi:hypothetical protein M422DRAFT_225698 [Sphaerobolus stellatus SS14]|nr:hypothetical protein M422DRAFT_225698 [Sphaerobolus stellatus SS14]
MTSPVIEEATPHLYLSGFNFIPENSILHKHFLACFSQRARVLTSQEAQWPALEVTLTGHTDWVKSAAFSPDGQRVVSGSDDKTIRIWNAHTGELLVSGPFEGHTDWVTSIAFSPDGQRVVSGSDDQTIRIWNAHTRELISGPFQGYSEELTLVAFSLGTQRLGSGSDNNHSQSLQTSGFIISFSPNKQHAINLLSLSESTTSLDSISFNSATGWILGPNNELILWIPFSYRERLWPPRCLVVMGLDVVDLDLSQFVHGASWTDCWEGQ